MATEAVELSKSEKKTEKKTEKAEEAETKPEPKIDMQATLTAMKRATYKGIPSYDQRVEWLDKLEKAVLANKEAFIKAIDADFGHRSRQETLIAEVFLTLAAIQHSREHLHEWMETESRPVSWLFAPARAEVMQQPVGVVGIIAPWNYPMQLALAPAAAALAAGNRVMIKPSELTPETSKVIAKTIESVFSSEEAVVIIGGADVGEAFSKLAFDHLLFTGSTRIGKVVMRAAAENLVPVTLELGGKSPTIVGPDFPVDVAATRIMHGKAFNSGQTCIAPDYVFVHKSKLNSFVDECKAQFAKMYPTLEDNPDYTSIVSDRHHARLKGLIEEATAKDVKVVECNPAKEDLTKARKMAPTLLIEPSEDLAVMTEEIFGPLLPIKTYEKLDEVIDYINAHPRPLALYYFGYDDADIAKVLERTCSGGVSVNETMFHFAQEDLPFGGVGSSGMGHYHGKEGFDTFTKKKPVFYQSRVNSTGLLRPPYGKLVDMVLRFLTGK